MSLGRRYAANGNQTVASPTKTMLGVTGGTAVRPVVYYLGIGSAATPADVALEWFIQRYTAAGTATALTPPPLDPGDPASTATAGYNHSAEPSYTSAKILWDLPLNQRASHSLIFDPNGGLMIPATANNGLGLYPVHASATPAVSGVMHFYE